MIISSSPCLTRAFFSLQKRGRRRDQQSLGAKSNRMKEETGKREIEGPANTIIQNQSEKRLSDVFA
jgi:hypothetical protein